MDEDVFRGLSALAKFPHYDRQIAKGQGLVKGPRVNLKPSQHDCCSSLAFSMQPVKLVCWYDLNRCSLRHRYVTDHSLSGGRGLLEQVETNP